MSTKYLSGVKESFINSVGTELCWGWSPAVDFMALLDGRIKNNAQDTSSEPIASSSSSSSKKKVIGFDEFGFPILGTEITADSKKLEQEGQNNENDQAATNKNPINILLAGAADIRHVVVTLARIRRTELGRSKRPIHFYIFEPSLRVHCRHLLFLQLLLVDLVTLAELEDRVSTVLEIFGNTLLRDITAGVLKNAALAVCDALDYEGGDDENANNINEEVDENADEDNNNNNKSGKNEPSTATAAAKPKREPKNTKLANWLDWSNMKAKERDFIAQQILLWTKNRSEVRLVEQWDSRVRQELAERYDHRVNIFDWDFNFHLLDYTQILRFPEYREFRKIGQAFDYCRINPRRGFRYDYTMANKSLAHFNPRTAKGSYNGDIKNGPFFALGQDTENPNFKKRDVDGTTQNGCGLIAMSTVRGWLYELLTGQQFPSDLPHKFAWDDDKNYNALPAGSSELHVGAGPEVAPCSFKMVGLDIEKFLEKIVRDHGEGNFFDAVFVGSTCTQWMGAPNFFKSVNAEHGVVVAETLKFVVDANDEAKAEFENKIVKNFAGPKGWEMNQKMTDSLHAHQLPARDRPNGVELDATGRKAKIRQKMNHAVVLTRKSSSNVENKKNGNDDDE